MNKAAKIVTKIGALALGLAGLILAGKSGFGENLGFNAEDIPEVPTPQDEAEGESTEEETSETDEEETSD